MTAGGRFVCLFQDNMLQYDEWTEYDISNNLFYDSLFDQTAKMLFIFN